MNELLSKLFNWIRSVVSEPKDEKSNSIWEPRSLTPTYIPEKHGRYLEKLLVLLSDAENRNLALSGSYGTGKSSIVDGFNRLVRYQRSIKWWRPRAIKHLSKWLFSRSYRQRSAVDRDIFGHFWTALDSHVKKTTLRLHPTTISLPTLHAELSSNALESLDNAETVTSSTNNVQREIVKHLLYRLPAERMPGSRFQRILSISKWKRMLTTLALSVVSILLVAQFQGQLNYKAIEGFQNGDWWFFGGLLLIFALLISFIDWRFVYKPTVKGVSTATAKVELTGSSVTYFDQYLDEIVYYFRQSGTNVVVFEDLDRYNNPYIFETLKELNDLVNVAMGSPRVSAGGSRGSDPIRFIYATRDSALMPKAANRAGNDQSYPSNPNSDFEKPTRIAPAEWSPADRIKFFDAILPVVPFSTARNASRTLKDAPILSQPNTISGDDQIDLRLREIIGRSIHDSRTISNLESEFGTYYESLYDHDADPGSTMHFLKPKRLLALMAFKTQSPAEFEKIPIQQSTLDRLDLEFLRRHGELVLEISRLQLSLENELKLAELPRTESAEMGEYLLAIIRESVSPSFKDSIGEVVIGDTSFPQEQFHSPEFWAAILDFLADQTDDEDGGIAWRDQSRRTAIRLPQTSIRLIITAVSGVKNPLIRKINNSRQSLNELKELAIKLRFPTYKELIGLTLSSSFTEIQNYGESFLADINSIFADEMTRQLIREGYIDRDYYLYASTSAGSLDSIDAQTFLTQQLERNLPAPALHLEAASAKELAEHIIRNRDLCESNGIYNGSLFVALVATQNQAVEEEAINLAKKLSTNGLSAEDNRQFIVSILELITDNGPESKLRENAKNSLAILVRHQPSLLNIAFDDAGLDAFELREESAIELLDTVLQQIDSGQYFSSEDAKQAFHKHCGSLPSLSNEESLSTDQVNKIVGAFDEATILIKDLRLVGNDNLRGQFLQMGLFEVNQENLLVLKAHTNGHLSLNHLFDAGLDRIYSRVLSDTQTYANALHAMGEAVIKHSDNPDTLFEIICTYLSEDNLLDGLLDATSTRLQVEDLPAFSEKARAIFVRRGMVASTLSNVDFLIDQLQEESPEFPRSEVIDFLRSIDRIDALHHAEEITDRTGKDFTEIASGIIKFLFDSEIEPNLDPQVYGLSASMPRALSLNANDVNLSWPELQPFSRNKVFAVTKAGFMHRGPSQYNELKVLCKDNLELISAYLAASQPADWMEPTNVTSPEEAMMILEGNDLSLEIRHQMADWIFSGEVSIDQNHWFRVAAAFHSVNLLLNLESVNLLLNLEQLAAAATALPPQPTSYEYEIVLEQATDNIVNEQNYEEFRNILIELGGVYSKILTPSGKKPKMQFTELNWNVVSIVKEFGTSVSSTSPPNKSIAENLGSFTVNLKRNG